MESLTPTEEENYKLLKNKLQLKVNEWDLFINRLKESAPVSDADLQDMWTRRLDVRKIIESIQKSLPESTTTLSKLRQLKPISRKLWSDYNNIYENYTEEDDNVENYFIRRQALVETHSDSQDHDHEIAKTSPVKQPQGPIIANTEAPATKSNRKRKKRQRRRHLLKLTPRPTKLNKATMMRILLRRKAILIQDRVKSLLDPARRPQCHPFPLRGRVKPSLYKSVYSAAASLCHQQTVQMPPS